jgi:hypothetical protein
LKKFHKKYVLKIKIYYFNSTNDNNSLHIMNLGYIPLNMKLINNPPMFSSPNLAPPLLTEPIEGLTCVDHRTYFVHPDLQDEFEEYWRQQGFTHRKEWKTSRFPATHIALTKSAEGVGCEDMIGLSVPPDMSQEANPLVRSLKLYGTHSINAKGELLCGKPQHVAYQLDSAKDFSEACGLIKSMGFEFICPELEYQDAGTGAALKQCFFVQKDSGAPWGTFAEIIQRIPGKNGEPYAGFEPLQIDELYAYLDSWSLERLQSYA